jgi:hypothetical protein
MNFEIIVGDIEHEWSLGVYASRDHANEIILAYRRDFASKGHDHGDHEFSIVETAQGLRRSIWPSSRGYSELLIAHDARKKGKQL